GTESAVVDGTVPTGPSCEPQAAAAATEDRARVEWRKRLRDNLLRKMDSVDVMPTGHHRQESPSQYAPAARTSRKHYRRGSKRGGRAGSGGATHRVGESPARAD